MRHFFALLIMSCGFCFTAFSQVQQGSFFLNTQLGYRSSESKKQWIDNWDLKSGYIQSLSGTASIRPAIGYFIADKIALGLGVGFSQSRTKNEFHSSIPTIQDPLIVGKFTENTVWVNPFARYYVSTKNDKLFFFVQGGVNVAVSQQRTIQLGSPTEAYQYENMTLGAELSPGFAFFPTPNWGFELLLRGMYLGYDEVGDEWTGVRLGRGSLSPSLGLSYFF